MYMFHINVDYTHCIPVPYLEMITIEYRVKVVIETVITTKMTSGKDQEMQV